VNRRTAIVVLALAAATVVPAAAMATQPDEDGVHKVHLCHVTNSATNEHVLISVDVAAFDGNGENDHTLHGDELATKLDNGEYTCDVNDDGGGGDDGGYG
jgi:hypothetical protein